MRLSTRALKRVFLNTRRARNCSVVDVYNADTGNAFVWWVLPCESSNAGLICFTGFDLCNWVDKAILPHFSVCDQFWPKAKAKDMLGHCREEGRGYCHNDQIPSVKAHDGRFSLEEVRRSSCVNLRISKPGNFYPFSR